MSRVFYSGVVRYASGRVVAGATLQLREPETHVERDLYAAESGDELASVITDRYGAVRGWVDAPAEVRAVIGGFAPWVDEWELVTSGGGGGGTQGPTGPEGAQGVPGPEGPTGAQGPQGPQGTTGEGVRILGEVATAAALPASGNTQGDAYIVSDDGDLYVWSTDTTPDKWINAGQVVGPQGPQGPQGVQGPVGTQGVQGAPGPAGAQGVQGPQGVKGDKGDKGDVGAIGPSGQSAGKIFYLAANRASDISGYKKLLTSPGGGAETTVATPCTGTSDVLVATFATDPGEPGAVDYPAGTTFRRIYAMVSAGTARFRLQVYKRTAAGVETLIRDEYSDNFTNQVVLLQTWGASSAVPGAMLATDRIVGKLYAQRVTGPTTVTVTTFYEGTSHVSHIQTTISAGSQGPQGEPGPVGPAGPWQDGKTYAVSGAIAAADRFPGFFVPVRAGTTVKLARVFFKIRSGTSLTFDITRNGSEVTGLQDLTADTSTDSADPTDVTLADGDYLEVVPSAANGEPTDFTATFVLETVLS